MELLNVQQAADFLGVHRGTIYAWVESGRLPCLRAGTRLRFIQADLLSWARSNGTESSAEEAGEPLLAMCDDPREAQR